MFLLSPLGWLLVALSGLIVGITKTSIPGIGILIIPLMASVFPARASTGIVLPMLMMGDVLAVSYYRKHAVARIILRILPFTALGVLGGFFAVQIASDAQMKYGIAIITLALVILTILQETRVLTDSAIPTNLFFAAVMGILAGFTTMVANAAGPIMTIYFLAMKLEKEEFISTGSWFFLLINLFKVPFSWQLGLITSESLVFNARLFPFILLGGAVGIFILRRISQQQFRTAAIALTALASIKLFF
jgi:uncharacterized membrane protein YfcA